MATTKKPSKVQSPVRLGNPVLIRSVTHFYTGRIVILTKDEIVLEDAAWIASTGRFADALKSGVLDEVEPFVHLVAVGRGAIVDVTSWTHELPKAQR